MNTACLQELVVVVKDYIFILTSGSSGGVTGTLLTASKHSEGFTIVWREV